MEQINQINYLSIDLLDKLGNASPSETQIELMELLISGIAIKQQLKFSDFLTLREIQCLFWAAKGMSAEKTAELLNITASTVESHRKEIKRKLKCTSMAQAVFQGMVIDYSIYQSADLKNKTHRRKRA